MKKKGCKWRQGMAVILSVAMMFGGADLPVLAAETPGGGTSPADEIAVPEDAGVADDVAGPEGVALADDTAGSVSVDLPVDTEVSETVDVPAVAEEIAEAEEDVSVEIAEADAGENSGALGTASQITWTYDESTKTLTITGTDELKGTSNGSTLDVESPFMSICQSKDVKIITFDNCKLTGSAYALFFGLSQVEEIDLTGLDTSAVTDMSYMFYGCSSLGSGPDGFDCNIDTHGVNDMSYMFSGCGMRYLNIYEDDIYGEMTTKFVTTSVTNMRGMFSNCRGLGFVNLDNFDTQNVECMDAMLSGCSTLNYIYLEGLDTSSVTSMQEMFSGCTGLREVYFKWDGSTKIDTSKVENMGLMFQNCSNLVNLDLSDFNTTSLTRTAYMFKGCEKLLSVDMSSFNMSGVTSVSDAEEMFAGCSSLETLCAPGTMGSVTVPLPCTLYDETDHAYDAISADSTGKRLTGYTSSGTMGVSGNLTWSYSASEKTLTVSGADELYSGSDRDYRSPFYAICQAKGAKKIMFENCRLTGKADALFSKLSNVEELDLSGLDTSGVTSMFYMFYGCSGLSSLDVSKLKTDNVTDMACMFMQCENVTSLDVRGFNTGNVTKMTMMFESCYKLEDLDVSGFKTSRVRTMDEMFDECYALSKLDVSHFDTSNVMYINRMFRNCSSLTSLDVSNFNTSNVIWIRSMFVGCSGLKELDLSSFDLSNVDDDVLVINYESILSDTVEILHTPRKMGSVVIPFPDNLVLEDEYGTVYYELSSENEGKTLTTPLETDQYRISYDGNGAEAGSVKSQICSRDKQQTIAANGFTRKGFTFAGWNTEVGGTGTKYDEQATVINIAPGGETIVLYAQWKVKEAAPEEPPVEPEPEKPEEPPVEPEPEKPEEPPMDLEPEKPEEPPVEPEPVKEKYTITYSLDGGANAASNPAGYDDASTAITLADPAKAGYTFVGWYKDAAMNKKKVTQIEPGTTGNILLFAKWTANTYTVKFNGNGAAGSMKDLKCSYGTWGVLIANKFKKTGSNFVGWNTKPDGTGVAYGNEAGVLNLTEKNNDTVTLYAQWKEGGYTITYKNLKGGINHAENPGWYDENTGATTLKAPTKEGYTFDGWYSDKKLKKAVSGIEAGSTGNKIFYAKWTAGSYTVKFDGNGGEGRMSDLANKIYGKSITLTANKYKRNGYIFAGWNTKKDGSGTPYKNKAKVMDLKTEGGTVTLYAQWSEVEYKIVYNLKKGTNNTANPKTYTISTDTIVLAAPTRSGYTFDGWYSDKKYKTPVTEINKGSTGNKKLYAKWKK